MPRIRRYTYFPTSACCSCHFPWTPLGFTYLVLRSHGQSATVASAATQNYTLHRYGSSSARLKLCASLGFPNTTSASYISHHIVWFENTEIRMMSFIWTSFYLWVSEVWCYSITVALPMYELIKKIMQFMKMTSNQCSRTPKSLYFRDMLVFYNCVVKSTKYKIKYIN